MHLSSLLLSFTSLCPAVRVCLLCQCICLICLYNLKLYSGYIWIRNSLKVVYFVAHRHVLGLTSGPRPEDLILPTDPSNPRSPRVRSSWQMNGPMDSLLCVGRTRRVL